MKLEEDEAPAFGIAFCGEVWGLFVGGLACSDAPVAPFNKLHSNDCGFGANANGQAHKEEGSNGQNQKKQPGINTFILHWEACCIGSWVGSKSGVGLGRGQRKSHWSQGGAGFEHRGCGGLSFVEG